MMESIGSYLPNDDQGQLRDQIAEIFINEYHSELPEVEDSLEEASVEGYMVAEEVITEEVVTAKEETIATPQEVAVIKQDVIMENQLVTEYNIQTEEGQVLADNLEISLQEVNVTEHDVSGNIYEDNDISVQQQTSLSKHQIAQNTMTTNPPAQRVVMMSPSIINQNNISLLKGVMHPNVVFVNQPSVRSDDSPHTFIVNGGDMTGSTVLQTDDGNLFFIKEETVATEESVLQTTSMSNISNMDHG